MYIVEVSTKTKFKIEIIPLVVSDYKFLPKKRYFFDWKTEEAFENFKLRIVGTKVVLGIISLQRIPEEWRVHVRLLTVSKENSGHQKQFDRIAGNLLAHAAKMAVQEYAEFACVSLKPKTKIFKHYIDKYKMKITGATLSIEVPEILDLINYYDHD